LATVGDPRRVVVGISKQRRMRTLNMGNMLFEMRSGGVPAGHYTVTFKGAEPWRENVEKYGVGTLFRFEVVGGDHDGEETSRITGSKLTPKSALAQILTGLGGRKIERGETIDPNSFVDQRYFAIVKETESGSTRVESIVRTEQ
jgi:hypothetical protein